MATKIVSITYQLKRGLQSVIEAKNPILAEGEPIVIFCNDGSTKLKIGDGKTPYVELDYISGTITQNPDSGEIVQIEIDSTLSEDSTNPVENRIITKALKDKVDKIAGKGLSSNDYSDEDKSNNYYDKTMSDIDDVDYTDNKGLSITRLGHTITFKLTISLNASIGPDANVTLGYFHYENMGCTRLAFTPFYLLAFNDTANNGAFWTLTATEGQLIIYEDLRKAGFKKGDSLSFLANLNIPPEYMLDEFCDKFYWKRTS